MGLDNIPANYACKNLNVAILDDQDRIDCAATIAANKCPHNEMKNKDPLIREAVIPLGMLGTNCWYRGKYGAYLLEQMRNFNDSFPHDENTLYGEQLDDEQEGLSSVDCILLSEDMFAYSESWVEYVRTASNAVGDAEKQKALINDWVYLAWWLKFVGENCDGMVSWY